MKNDNEKETTQEEGLDNLSDVFVRKPVLTKHVLLVWSMISCSIIYNGSSFSMNDCIIFVNLHVIDHSFTGQKMAYFWVLAYVNSNSSQFKTDQGNYDSLNIRLSLTLNSTKQYKCVEISVC